MITEVELVKLITSIIAKEMKIHAEEIQPTHSFFEIGLDSISAIFMMEELEQQLSIELNPIFFWDYPTIEKYANYIANEVIPNEPD